MQKLWLLVVGLIMGMLAITVLAVGMPQLAEVADVVSVTLLLKIITGIVGVLMLFGALRLLDSLTGISFAQIMNQTGTDHASYLGQRFIGSAIVVAAVILS